MPSVLELCVLTKKNIRVDSVKLMRMFTAAGSGIWMIAYIHRIRIILHWTPGFATYVYTTTDWITDFRRGESQSTDPRAIYTSSWIDRKYHIQYGNTMNYLQVVLTYGFWKTDYLWSVFQVQVLWYDFGIWGPWGRDVGCGCLSVVGGVVPAGLAAGSPVWGCEEDCDRLVEG